MPRSESNNDSLMPRWSALALFACAVGLSGCTADFSNVASSGPAPVSGLGGAIHGSVHGGQQPVTGATIQLYGVGTTGYGSAATPLLTQVVTTDQNGGFNITGDYTCPTSNMVYLTAAGGNPGLGTGGSNPAIALVAAIGNCSTFKTNAATTFIQLNEATTVAAIWALQQFSSTTGTALSANSTTASDNIGASAGNLQGLINAMGTANVLASVSTGGAPGNNTSSNTYNVESWQVNTIANILAACVNTAGPTTSPATPNACNTLFTNTNGAMDTFQAGLYMALHPANAVSTLNALSSTAAPFQPSDTSVNDFTIGLSYKTGTYDSRWIAIDQFGNAWISTNAASALEMDPTGNILTTATSYTLGTATSTTPIGASYEVALDTANNAWFTDNTKTAIFEELGSGSAGVAGAGPGIALTTSGISTGTPEGIAVDGNSNVWATIPSAALAEVPSGSTSSSTVKAGAVATSAPYGIAVDLSNHSSFGNSTLSSGGSFIYAVDSAGCGANITVDGVASQTGGSIVMAYTVAGTNGGTAGTATYAAGAATDLNYIVDTACNNTTNVPNGGTIPGSPSPVAAPTPRVMMSSPFGIAFDHSNDMWLVNKAYTSVSDNSSGQYSLTKVAAQNYGAEGSVLSAANDAAGFSFLSIDGGTGGLSSPYYIAIDGNGAAWVANSAGNGLSAFTNAGANISPSSAFAGGSYTSGTTTYARSYSGSRGIAIDGSGNVWVANPGVAYVTLVIGAATPTVTPLALGIKNGTLATAP
jgi:hypothetical protein